MMIIIYDKKGKEVKMNFAIDAQAALETGEYFEVNPVSPKVEAETISEVVKEIVPEAKIEEVLEERHEEMPEEVVVEKEVSKKRHKRPHIFKEEKENSFGEIEE